MKFRQQRHRTDFPTRMRNDASTFSALILDISTGGAQIKCPERLHVGQLVTLTIMNTPVRGAVRWTSHNRAGIAFDAPLSLRLLEVARYLKGPGSKPYRTTVGFRPAA
jgi:hypothetical protein